jgi:dUTP pyrophosphatase
MSSQTIIQTLLQEYNYDKIMHLKIYVNSTDEMLKTKYNEAIQKRLRQSYNYIDAGFDLYLPEVPLLDEETPIKVDYQIQCSAEMLYLTYDGKIKSYHTGYYLHPRSSIYKTHLRLANSTGIIDAGYRGNIQAVFDDCFYCRQRMLDDNSQAFVSDDPHYGSESIRQYNRYVQLCAPGLVPIVAELVTTFEELGEVTSRGEGGFGSSGK